MTTSYLPYHPDQAHLLPVSASDWLPDGHRAYFIADAMTSLDLSAFHARCAKGGPRNQPFNPEMMGNLEKPSLSRAQAAYFPPPPSDTRPLA